MPRSTLERAAGAPTTPEPGDRFAAELRGWGPIGWLGTLVVVAGNLVFAPLSAVLALVWARSSRTPWSALGLTLPRPWWPGLIGGIVLGTALKLLMKTTVMPLLGAPSVNAAFHYLVGNTAALPSTLLMVIVVAGIGEEVLFRGFLFERLRGVVRGRFATPLIVVLTSVLFGLAHLPSQQGVPAAEQALLTGLVTGAVYAWSKSLWVPIIAHATFDIVAVAIIYFDLEVPLARLWS